MKTHALLLVVGTLFCLTDTVADDGIESWQVVELGQAGDLTVRLRVKQQTSLADAEWIAIELDNRGDQGIEIEHVSYRIESVRHDLKTGKEVSRGSLASGQDHALFPHAWKTTPVSPRVVKPGVYRVIDHPSLYSSALLGLPPKDGSLVKAEIFFDMRINNKLIRFAGRKFQFQWLYPDKVGFEQMRERLKHLLQNPRDYVQHAYILHTLLEIPEVAKAASTQELLAAIAPRTHSFSGREYVLRHINDHYADDQIVIDYFFDRLVAADKRIMRDLRGVFNVWQAKFLPPLIERFETDRASVRDIFEILRQRGTPQKSDPKLAQRLSSALLKHGWMKRAPGQTLAPYILADSLLMMGKTHDREMIPRLMPYLDDKTQTIDPKVLSAFSFRLPPLRVCDNALEAILMILDGGPDAAYKEAGFELSKDFAFSPKDVAETTKIRDQMIERLKRRLTELNIDAQR